MASTLASHYCIIIAVITWLILLTDLVLLTLERLSQGDREFEGSYMVRCCVINQGAIICTFYLQIPSLTRGSILRWLHWLASRQKAWLVILALPSCVTTGSWLSFLDFSHLHYLGVREWPRLGMLWRCNQTTSAGHWNSAVPGLLRSRPQGV